MAKVTNETNDPNEVPNDIRQRILDDFGPERANNIYRYLLNRIPVGLPNGTRPRHLRCILYLAKGDKTLLDRSIEVCLQDTRDTMLQAEYETDSEKRLVRVRDFGKPFAESRIEVRKAGDAE